MAVPPIPVRVPSQRSLAPSVTSVTSVANDKDDNEIIPRAGHRSPGIVKGGKNLDKTVLQQTEEKTGTLR